MGIKKYVAVCACLLLWGCGDDSKPVATGPKVAGLPAIQAPFRYHKHIRITPGNDFDVFSWGRGSTEAGALLILHSDSAEMIYTTTTGDLPGKILDVYNTDMDADGNPELLIQGTPPDTTTYMAMYPYEFGDKAGRKLDFPKLTRRQARGYLGRDNFYVRDGKLIREFPIHESDSSNAKPTGAKRVLEYTLRNNAFSVEQLSKDSTDKDEVTNVAPAQKKQTVRKSSRSKKKKSSSRHRRRRRH
jgi:hypothetical protein